ncbi:MAG: DUF167 family protein [Gammaproteobacteria bacterium]|nr:DUF167 family protein [Gammaproteobacteria bacterium]
MSHFEWQGEDLVLRIRVQPRSSQEGFAEVLGDQIKLRVNAPPVDGKANAQLIQFLSKLFKVPKGQIRILSGETGRDKRIRISKSGQCPEQFSSRTPA